MGFIVKLRIILDKFFSLFKGMDSNTIKNIVITILAISVIGVGLSYYFKDDKKALIQRLESEAKVLKDERKKIQFEIDSLKKENLKLNNDKNNIENILNQDNDVINTYIGKANKSQQDLDILKKQQSDINKKIDDIKNHPANRKDDALIYSLRNHLNERMKNK